MILPIKSMTADEQKYTFHSHLSLLLDRHMALSQQTPDEAMEPQMEVM